MKGGRRLIAAGIILLILCLVCAFLFMKVRGGTADVSALNDRYDKIVLGVDGEVESLRILPLVEFFTLDDKLATEAGVSYLVRAGDTTILMDTALNRKGAHPSPLLANMEMLGIDMSSISMIFLSHIHPDHVGGMRDAMKGTFSLSRGSVPLNGIPVYAPEKVTPSSLNMDAVVHVNAEPFRIGEGIASTGNVSRYCLMGGVIKEQSLMVRLKGKGTVIIIGCGHGGLDRIIKRARSLWGEPVYAIVGGIHLPLDKSRIGPKFLNIQNFGASERFPLGSVTMEDVDHAITCMKESGARIIALSGHDSSDAALAKISSALGDRFRILRAGEPLDL